MGDSRASSLFAIYASGSPPSLLDPSPVLLLLEFVVDLLKSSIVAVSGGEM